MNCINSQQFYISSSESNIKSYTLKDYFTTFIDLKSSLKYIVLYLNFKNIKIIKFNNFLLKLTTFSKSR